MIESAESVGFLLMAAAALDHGTCRVRANDDLGFLR